MIQVVSSQNTIIPRFTGVSRTLLASTERILPSRYHKPKAKHHLIFAKAAW
jgi:hypothetical protein